MMDPNKTTLVLKNAEGREIGRIAATARNANEYLTEMARAHNGMKVEYVHDEDAWIGALLMGGRR